jgi:hypothetical protein
MTDAMAYVLPVKRLCDEGTIMTNLRLEDGLK